MQKTAEIKALISLLDDPDENIYNSIEQKLISYGNDVIINLEEAWQQNEDPLFQERVENIIHRLQYDQVKIQLHKWAIEGGQDLLQGAILLSRYFYPTLDLSQILTPLQQIRTYIWLEFNNSLSASESVNIINHHLFGKYHLQGEVNFMQDVTLCFLNKLLQSHKGNPYSLSLLYLIIAQQLHLPIYGVNLFAHFILCYTNEEIKDFTVSNKNKIIFYINPFNKGDLFNKSEIDKYLQRIDKNAMPEYYEPCNNVETMYAYIKHILFNFELNQMNDKAKEMRELLQILDEFRQI